MARILVIDGQPSARLALRRFLESEGHSCEATEEIPLAGDDFDLALVDAQALRTPDALAAVGARQVIVLTREGAPPWPTSAGAAASLGKPLDFRQLARLMARCLDPAPPVALAPADPVAAEGNILTCNPLMQRVLEEVARLASFDITVLITGESGTGKELVARALHERGPRAPEPFEAIHCGAIVADLLESELFGHEKGSFTDAHASKPGRFETAGAGTIFLDEIGDMPLPLQVKLLRALQEREIQRIGGLGTIPVRARIVAATHRDLRRRVAAGEFRADLFHRLQVATLFLPPLRERQGDLELLAAEFLARFGRKHARALQGISAAGLASLRERSWPGNVRELANVLERAVVLARGPVLDVADFEDPTSAVPSPSLDDWRRSLEWEIDRRRREGQDPDSIRTALRREVDQMLADDRRGRSPRPPADGEA